jgi:hypothetical protein
VEATSADFELSRSWCLELYSGHCQYIHTSGIETIFILTIWCQPCDQISKQKFALRGLALSAYELFNLYELFHKHILVSELDPPGHLVPFPIYLSYIGECYWAFMFCGCVLRYPHVRKSAEIYLEESMRLLKRLWNLLRTREIFDSKL